MPLRPIAFDVPAHDPFASDRLERREHVIALCELVLREPGPTVLAVNGSFGAGKSVFLKMCAAHLRIRDATVAEFNAWQQSHTGIPIVDMMASLISQISAPTVGQQFLERLSATATAIGERAVNKLTAGLYEPGDSRSGQHRGLEDWKEAQAARDGFRKALAEAAAALEAPLFILIDELDRCVPRTAIDILDTARHLLDVAGVIVILGVNHDELRRRVEMTYGGNTETATFLRRFIDHTFDLAGPDYLQLAHVAARTMAPESGLAEAGAPQQAALADYALEFGLSLRDLEQLTLRVSAVLARHTPGQGPPNREMLSLARAKAITAICALRMAQPEQYARFFGPDADPLRAAAEFLTVADDKLRHETVITLCTAALSHGMAGPQGLSDIESAGVPHPEQFQAALLQERKRLILLVDPGPRPQELIDFAF